MENLVVENWLSKVANSEQTRKSYLSKIEQFSKYLKEQGLNIETLKESYREAKYKGEIEKERFLDGLQDVIEGYMAYVKTLDYSPMHERLLMSIISSFLKKGCGIKDIDILIRKRAFVKFHNRDITKEEIRKILEHASLRERAFFMMMCESGLRPSTLLQLRYKYIKEDFEKGVIPMKISLPSSILKDKIPDRFTFIGEDGYRILKEYLSTRKLSDNNLIFAPIKAGRMKGEIITESSLSNIFNKLVQKLGLDTSIGKAKPKGLKLYCLRKYFWNNMRCESTYKSFWFCHSSIDDHYLSSTDIETHRKIYAEGYKFLRIYEPSANNKVSNLEDELKKAYQTIGQLQQIVTTLASNETISNILGKDKEKLLEQLQKLKQ
jgi:integrase